MSRTRVEAQQARADAAVQAVQDKLEAARAPQTVKFTVAGSDRLAGAEVFDENGNQVAQTGYSFGELELKPGRYKVKAF